MLVDCISYLLFSNKYNLEVLAVLSTLYTLLIILNSQITLKLLGYSVIELRKA